MRWLLRLLFLGVVLTVLAGAVALWDVTANGARLFYGLMGRDRIEAACLPVLAAQLRQDGFEPSDITFGERPSIASATGSGTRLDNDFTFLDGAAQARVDGAMACAVEGETVTVRARTRSTPVRAG